MAVRKIQTKRRCICYTRKASKNEENLRTQAHDVESVRITRLDDGEKLRKREYSRELLSIYGEVGLGSLLQEWFCLADLYTLIFMDPYDTSDHLQDGYTVGNGESFYAMWFDHSMLPETQRQQPWMVVERKDSPGK